MHLDIAGWKLIDGEVRVHLTRAETDMMVALADGKLASMNRLINALWGCDGPESAYKVVQLMVYRLRKKFVAAGLPPLIMNIWGRGYFLSLAVAVDRPDAEPIVIPAEHRSALERLLFSHPDHAAADRVLASFVGA